MAGIERRWLFTKDQLRATPSSKHGILPEKELYYRQQTANFIQDMGQKLQVTQLCINTALVYMHRFYMFQSFSKFNRHNIAAAALFLAAKVEEQPRKLEHVIRVAHMCLNREAAQLDPKSEAYLEQAQELVVNENILLQSIGFDITVDHPHKHVVQTCQLVRASKDLAQTSYFLATNSLHLTNMCLQYRPTVVACVCIHLACKWSAWEIPRSSEGKEWFWYTDKEVTLEMLEEITTEFLNILETCPSKLKKKIMTWKSGKDRDEEQGMPTNKPARDLSEVASTSSASAAAGGPSTSKEPPPPPPPSDHKDGRGRPEGPKPQQSLSDSALRRVKTEPSLSRMKPGEYLERKKREAQVAAAQGKPGEPRSAEKPRPDRHHLDALMKDKHKGGDGKHRTAIDAAKAHDQRHHGNPHHRHPDAKGREAHHRGHAKPPHPEAAAGHPREGGEHRRPGRDQADGRGHPRPEGSHKSSQGHHQRGHRERHPPPPPPPQDKSRMAHPPPVVSEPPSDVPPFMEDKKLEPLPPPEMLMAELAKPVTTETETKSTSANAPPSTDSKETQASQLNEQSEQKEQKEPKVTITLSQLRDRYQASGRSLGGEKEKDKLDHKKNTPSSGPDSPLKVKLDLRAIRGAEGGTPSEKKEKPEKPEKEKLKLKINLGGGSPSIASIKKEEKERKSSPHGSEKGKSKRESSGGRHSDSERGEYRLTNQSHGPPLKLKIGKDKHGIATVSSPVPPSSSSSSSSHKSSRHSSSHHSGSRSNGSSHSNRKRTHTSSPHGVVHPHKMARGDHGRGHMDDMANGSKSNSPSVSTPDMEQVKNLQNQLAHLINHQKHKLLSHGAVPPPPLEPPPLPPPPPPE